MRRRVYLVRHAEVAYFADPTRPVQVAEVALTAAGIEQARATGRALRGARFDRVITSGLPRTVQTAELVIEQLEHPAGAPAHEAWPDLQEIRAGDPVAIPEAELEAAFLSAWVADPDHDATFLGGGETIRSLTARVDAALARLYADPGWETVMLVLHGGTNRAVLSWAMAGPGAFFGHLEQAYACVNVIDGEPGALVIRGMNLTPYDPAHLLTRTTTLEDMLAECRAYRAQLG